jgi:hypothetical protein
MAAPRKNKESQHSLADKWGTTQKNVSLMRDKGCDFDAADEVVAKWLLSHAHRKSKPMKEAIDLILKPKRVKVSKVESADKTAEDLRDEYFAELRESKSEGDQEREKISLDAFLKIDKQIRDSEAHAKKIGIDKGELLSRGEVERILRAMFWAGNACCDKFSKQIAQRLSDKKPAEVHKILKPTLTALTLFEGLKRVAKTPGDVNLPEWVIECSRTEETQYLKPNE